MIFLFQMVYTKFASLSNCAHAKRFESFINYIFVLPSHIHKSIPILYPTTPTNRCSIIHDIHIKSKPKLCFKLCSLKLQMRFEYWVHLVTHTQECVVICKWVAINNSNSGSMSLIYGYITWFGIGVCCNETLKWNNNQNLWVNSRGLLSLLHPTNI